MHQVLGRIEDVQQMCDRRKASLRKLLDKPPRPVQPVMPEPARSSHNSGGNSRSRGPRLTRKTSLPVDLDREKLEVVRLDGLELYSCPVIESSDSDGPYPTSPASPEGNSDTLQTKRGWASCDNNTCTTFSRWMFRVWLFCTSLYFSLLYVYITTISDSWFYLKGFFEKNLKNELKKLDGFFAP